MSKDTIARGVLGNYKSIWEGIEDPLERDLFSDELRKNHRRTVKQIRRVVTIRYWGQIVRWALEDMRIYFPLFGGIILSLILLFIISY